MADLRVTSSVDTPTLPPVVAWSAIVVLVMLAVIRSAVATRTARDFSEDVHAKGVTKLVTLAYRLTRDFSE